ncbi:MAG: hypothetical protein M0Q91_12615 [Methanoregula sp.]|jgi:hypothetical protein|nr:hypothetical protein [Methanoregula sp.]
MTSKQPQRKALIIFDDECERIETIDEQLPTDELEMEIRAIIADVRDRIVPTPFMTPKDALEELINADKFVSQWVGGEYVPQLGIRKYLRNRIAELRKIREQKL